jgi:hypothetical protein
MAHPNNAIVARHALTAMVVVMILVLIGTLARSLYIGIVRPSSGWVVESHENPFKLAFGIGLAAVVIEWVFSYTKIRERHCKDYLAVAPATQSAP